MFPLEYTRSALTFPGRLRFPASTKNQVERNRQSLSSSKPAGGCGSVSQRQLQPCGSPHTGRPAQALVPPEQHQVSSRFLQWLKDPDLLLGPPGCQAPHQWTRAFKETSKSWFWIRELHWKYKNKFFPSMERSRKLSPKIYCRLKIR